jgi:glycosyltransferase domain-containing protein
MMLKDITLIIPTKNRHLYLARALEYYSNSGLNIIVADATTKKFTLPVPGNVEFLHYPNVPYCDKLSDVLRKVNTTYTLLCADDDFILPSAIKTCVDFLEGHPEYKSAQGHYVFYNYHHHRFYYTPAYVETIGADINDKLPSKRMASYNSIPIQLYYCVHHTATLKYVFDHSSGKITNLNLVELLIGYAAIICGKHKVLPIFYAQRELLYGSAGKSDRIDVISNSPEYKEQYELFLESMIDLLKKEENLSVTQATSIMKNAIVELIARRLNKPLSFSERMSKWAKKTIPFWLRREVRYVIVERNAQRRIDKNLLFAKAYQGYPFIEGTEDHTIMKKIEALILKHNIVQ